MHEQMDWKVLKVVHFPAIGAEYVAHSLKI
jgi:hypothetical protein